MHAYVVLLYVRDRQNQKPNRNNILFACQDKGIDQRLTGHYPARCTRTAVHWCIAHKWGLVSGHNEIDLNESSERCI